MSGETGGAVEVQGVFPSTESLEAAMQALQVAGFHRADLSLPMTAPPPALATPDAGSENPVTEDDARQLRTMGTSTIGATGALIGAGVVIATGGAALVAGAAAAAIGAGAAAATSAVHQGIDRAREEERQALAADGKLVLAVHATEPGDQARAIEIMQRHGASRAEAVHRTNDAVGAVDSTSWTG